jgi:ABC-type nitrate/sulfonate/bicarbonate transport system substrate-binding protein
VFIWGINPYLKQYGLKVDCTEFANYTAALQALAKGDIDVGIVGVPQIATIAANNLNGVKVITGYSLGGQNIVMGSADKDVTTWSQLAGKTIGVPTGTGVGIMLNVALDQHNLVGKVKITEAGFNPTTVLTAMQKKQWDGTAYWSPVADQIVANNYGQYVSGIDLNCTTVGPAEGLIAATSKFLTDHTEVVNLLKGFTASMAAELANPQTWAQQGAELTGTPLNVNVAATDRQQPSYIIDVQAAKNLAPYGPKFGFATSDATSKIDSVIDASYLAEATGKSVADVTGRAVMPTSKSSC